jgi:hypothetical protein
MLVFTTSGIGPSKRRFWMVSVLAGMVGVTLASDLDPSRAAEAAVPSPLRVVLTAASGEQVLSEISPDSRHLEPRGRGVVLSKLLDDAMAGLTAEARSQVDLVILKGDDGRQASIPRAFITKVPMRIVVEGGKGSQTRFRAVVPEYGRVRSLREDLPWGTYEVPAVSRVELTSYQTLWGSQFLKRRTDPAALRGEKLFVQNCMSCHASAVPEWKGKGPGFAQALPQALSRHPQIQGLKPLDGRSSRALVSYWTAWSTEPTGSASTGNR